MSSLLRSSKFVRYFAKAARSLVANSTVHCSPLAGQLQNSAPCGNILRCLSSQVANTASQYSNLEKSLQQLDYDVRRSGRISRRELEEVLEEFKHTKNATSSQSLMVIRCCGNLIPEELPEVRTQLVKKIWATMEQLKVPMDISHYNALLRVYLENEHNFSPAEFLQDLEKKGVEPNRVTYQRLITRYCQEGDIEGATRILEFMREKGLPVNETVFNALIMGHSQAEDMDSAFGILAVMKQAGLEPSSETYTTLLVGYAKRGDMDKIREIFSECDKSDIYLMDKDHLEIVYALAVSGHANFVDEILARIRKSPGFNQDAVSLVLRLINKGLDEVALKVFRLMPRLQREDAEEGMSYEGSFLIKQMVKAQRPVESILNVCQHLESEGYNYVAKQIAVEACLHCGNVDQSLKLLKAWQESGAPIRPHYFWPLLCAAGRNRNDNEVAVILTEMQNTFGIYASGDTIRDYVLPNISLKNNDDIIGFLLKAGISIGASASALVHEYLQNDLLDEALKIATRYRAYYPPESLRRSLNIAFLRDTSKVESYASLVHIIYENIDRRLSQERVEGEIATVDRRDLVGSFLRDLLIASKHRNVPLESVLKNFLDRGLGISSETAEFIQSHLSGEQLTNEISELLSNLTNETLEATQALREKRKFIVVDETKTIERIKKLEEAGQPTASLKRSLLQTYCIQDKDPDKALAIFKELGDDVSPPSYAFLIECLTFSGRLDEAIEYTNKLRAAHPDAGLDALKVVQLVEELFKVDRVEEGIRLLEDQGSLLLKRDDISFRVKASAFQALNILAEKGDVTNINRTFELLVKHGYVEVTNALAGPLLKVHFIKDDIPGALKKFEEVVEKYKVTPWKNELLKKLIDTEDAVALQRVTDISSKIHGEVNSLYDLVFAFVECGRIRQARKILETPGLRNRPDKFINICERYQSVGRVEALENLMEATKDMNHIDRSDICNQLLNTYINNNDPEKALGLWTQMQEEDLQPSDTFLYNLATFLEKKGMNVPFVKPSAPTQLEPRSTRERTINRPPVVMAFRNTLKSTNLAAVEAAKAQVEAENKKLSTYEMSHYIEVLIQNNQMDKAVKEAVQLIENGGIIYLNVFKFLCNKLSEVGDVDSLTLIGSKINMNTKKALSFDNKLGGAYLRANRGPEMIDMLLKEIESASPAEVDSLHVKFPRGVIAGIIEQHPNLLPKLEEIAENYAKYGLKGPANILWTIVYVMPGMEEHAESLWQKYKLSEEPRPMFQRILRVARNKNDYELLRKLLEKLKNTKVAENVLGVIHSNALNILVAQGQTGKAMDHLKLALNDLSLESIYASTLRNLKKSVELSGQEFPYTIPDVSSKNESSSSSDDENESK